MSRLTVGEVYAKLDEIHSHVAQTNGHVAALWETTYGNHDKHIRGLVADVEAIKQYVAAQQAVARVLKVVLPLLTAGNVGVLVKLLAG